jgi:hypothetical protein
LCVIKKPRDTRRPWPALGYRASDDDDDDVDNNNNNNNNNVLYLKYYINTSLETAKNSRSLISLSIKYFPIKME